MAPTTDPMINGILADDEEDCVVDAAEAHVELLERHRKLFPSYLK